MELEIMTALFSAATFCCVWLFSRPQKVEMRAIREKMEADAEASHISLNRNSEAIEKLTQELQESREDRAKMNAEIKTLFNSIKNIKTDVEHLQQNMLDCRRGDKQCLKN